MITYLIVNILKEIVALINQMSQDDFEIVLVMDLLVLIAQM